MRTQRSMPRKQKKPWTRRECCLSLGTLLLLLLLLLPAPYTEAREQLKVGYVPGTGFLSEDRPGHQQGNGYEYMEFLAKYGDWQFVYVPCVNWWEAGEKLSSGEIDLLPAMPGDYRTLPQAVRADHVIARFPMELVVKNELYNASRLKLGTLRYNYPIPSLPAVAAEHGFSYDLLEFNDQTEMEQAFQARQIDGYVDPLLHPEKKERVLAIFDRVSYRLLVHKDRPELLARVNFAMDQLLMNQPNIRNQLNDKYERSKGFPLVLTPAELSYLEEKQNLHVAVLMRERPYFYWEDEGWQGALRVMLAQMERDLGLKTEIVDYSSMEELQRLILRGAVDVVADVPCDFSWLRGLSLAPTQPYADVYYVPVTRQDAHLPASPKVVTVEDAFYTQEYVENLYPRESITYVASLEDALRAVSNGFADIAYTPRAMAPYLIESEGLRNLEAGTESHNKESVSLGVSLDADPRLWHILNKEVNHLPPNLINDAMVNVEKIGHFSLSPMRLIYHYPLQAALLIILVMGSILGAFYYRYLTRKHHMETIQQMAYTDLRYQMPNLLWLEQELPKLITPIQEEQPETRFFLAVFDMNSKSTLVELYGRHFLDAKLKETALALEEKPWVLKCITGLDGGQFAALCRAREPEEVITLAAEAATEYGQLTKGETQFSLHVKVGLCELMPETNLLDVEERARTACLELKGTTKQVLLYDADMEQRLIMEHLIESSVEKALARREFMAWYQPKYDLATHKVVGAEALIRWQSKEMGFMPPGKFIPTLETNGYVIPVDYFILEETMNLLRRRLAAKEKVVTISVNQSRLHLTEEGYLERMRNLMEKYQLPQGLLELEITETMFGDFDDKSYRERTSYILNELRAMGYGLSLDDFGSGFSSFTMLDYLPLDAMKIDRSILVASDNSTRMQDILKSIIRLGKRLRLNVICEGVETKEQEERLLRLGCNYGQGYAMSKPLPEKDFVQFLDAH